MTPTPENHPEGWRTIDTAPKDGTIVDIWMSFIDHEGKIKSNGPDGRFPDVYWDNESQSWEGDDMRHFETYDWKSLEPGQAGLIVAHWRPRPLPPPPCETLE